jgi:hypothetical protein
VLRQWRRPGRTATPIGRAGAPWLTWPAPESTSRPWSRTSRPADNPEIMTAPHSPTSPDDTTRKTDVNLTHVAAAALAAVTTAVLGSELGAAGTLVGAAGASVLTTVGTAVYQASLDRSRKRVQSLAQRARPVATRREGLRTEPPHRSAPDAPVRDFTDSAHPVTQSGARPRRFATLRWGAVVVGALGAFLVAMMAITGFEWVSGGTVGGNGGGTTIGHVVGDQPGPREPAPPPTPQSPGAPASETPTDTTEAPDTATTSPDGGTTVERSPTKTSGRATPSEVTTTPPALIPLPGLGG